MSKLVVLPPPIVPAPADQAIVVDELIAEGYREIPLHLVRISYTNRTRFNPEALQQLAENIAEVGILQPILMRPVTPTAEAPQILEIVAGERRFRAAVIAGLAAVPAGIKHLSDKQAAEIQLLENIQRENPHPLEEAIGFEQLMLKHGYNAEELAAKVKQSRSYVYARLKLCALSLRARELFLDDIQRFPASTALLIARIPTPQLQDKALSEIMAPQYGTNEPMSVRQAAQHIASRYTLDLGAAVFDTKDAKLMGSAGSCIKCPKRTGNQLEVYADAKSADVCTDPDCFAEKKAAHYQRLIVVANKSKLSILEGADASNIRSSAWSGDAEFVIPATNLWSFDRVAKSTGMSGTVGSRLESSQLPKPVKYLKETGGVVTPVYRRSEVQAALEQHGVCESEQAQAERLAVEEADPEVIAARQKQQERETQQAQQREALKRKATAMTAERVALYRKLRESARNGIPLSMLRELAKLMIRDDMNWMTLPDDLIGDLYPFGRDDEAACAFIDTADAATVQLLIMDLVVGEGLGVSTNSIDEEEADPDTRYRALLAVAFAEAISIDCADIAAAAATLAALGIDVDDLEAYEDVLDVLQENQDHLAAVCAHIVAKAPHHTANVEAAANSLGYSYGIGGWQKKESASGDAVLTKSTSADDDAQQPEQATVSVRAKITLKKKADVPHQEGSAPIVRVKKDRAAQAAAALTPATAWPFPTIGAGK
jgi:ParB/RepB/Spo0J family partition protein